MKVYNTLTRTKEDFAPLRENKVSMYVCGPTVYDKVHIGNARPFVVFDTVRRYLEYKGYDVHYVQNYTDVDDKIIKKANAEGVDFTVIINRYIAMALEDEQALGNKDPHIRPRVTEEMPEIIGMIEELLQKGFAYEEGGTVFFNTTTMVEYGALSKKNIEELSAGIRVQIDEQKKNPADFVLWKPAKPDEPSWSSPWGDGRPGWHIECSAMIRKYIGETTDIHAGGEDLIFPHHENELAQSISATGKPLAKYWMHNGFINIDNQKMSKSKGNFFMLRDIAESYPYNVIRFFIISAHYKSPLNFSDELLQAAQNSLNRILNALKNLRFLASEATGDEPSANEKALLEDSNRFRKQFEESMDDDFNTADAVSAIFELVRFANIHASEEGSKHFAKRLHDEIFSLCELLGLKTDNDSNPEVDAAWVEGLIAERQEARKNKNYKRADEIRNQLQEQNILLEDTSAGPRWQVKKA